MAAKTAHSEHHHHAHNAKAFVREVAASCEMRGLRLTEIRMQVLELIANAHKPVKAYDLLDPFDERQKPGLSDTAIMNKLRRAWAEEVKEAQVTVYPSSAIPGTHAS